MIINVSKTDYNSLFELVDKCVNIIQSKNPTNREYNTARRLRLLMKKIERKSSMKCDNGSGTVGVHLEKKEGL